MIGTDVDGTRSLSAIGRARTFLPLLDPDGTASIRTSLLLPLLARVRRLPDGNLANADQLITLCAPGGRLRTLLDLARGSPGIPLTLVIDPGLLDALADLALGVEPFPLGTRGGEAGGDTPAVDNDSDGDAKARVSSVPGGLAAFVRTDPVGEEPFDQRTVRLWLRDLVLLTQRTPVWATGYAQPDLAALPTQASPDDSLDPVPVRVADRLRTATTRATTATLSSFDIDATPVWWPPQGYAGDTALTRASGMVQTSILGSASLPNRPEGSSSLVEVKTTNGVADVVVDIATYRDGGPAPGDQDSALQVRQRIAAETALQSLALTAQGRRGGSATVVLGRFWDPGTQWSSAAFFSAFSTPWLRTYTTQEQLDRNLEEYDGSAVVPETVLLSALPGEVVRSVARLDRLSEVLTELVRGATVTDALDLFYDEVAATALSQRWRARPQRAQAYARRNARALVDELNAVSVEIPSFVTLSSRSGSFGVTISNGTEQPVTVGVDFDSGGDRFTLPDVDAIRVGAGERRTVLVDASVTEVAVDEVTARLTTASGSHFGRPTTFTLRTSVLGVVIWVALGAGAGFVLLVFLRQSLRRSRTSRAAE